MTPGMDKGLANDYTYREIYRKIISLELIPGERINPIKLSEEMNVSRTPIQHACSKLSEIGLMNVIPQRGSYVSLIDINKVYQSFSLRNLMEQAAVRRIFAMNSSKRIKLVSTLKRNIYDQEIELKSQHYQNYYDFDRKFHHAIFSAADMLYIEQATEQISTDQDRIRQLKVMYQIRMDTALAEHRHIIDTLEHGKPEEVALAIYEHISKFAEDTDIIHQKYPDYFETWQNNQKVTIKKQERSFYDFDLN